ncbi:MAG: hypothetical protein AB1349_03335 [Elusimicrobiota bacterium]
MSKSVIKRLRNSVERREVRGWFSIRHFACSPIRLLTAICYLLFAICYLLFAASIEINPDNFLYVDWNIPHKTEEFHISYVYSGDIVLASTGEQIKLLGVKTTTDDAKKYTAQRLEGRDVALVYENGDGGKYGLVFYKDIENKIRCHNWELIKKGFAAVQISSQNYLCIEQDWEQLSKIALLKNVNDYITLAELSSQERFDYDAVQLLQDGIKKFTNHLELYETLATLYSALNQPGLELDVYLAYTEKNTVSAAIKRKLAICYEKMAKSTGIFSIVNYKQKAVQQWQELLGTEYDTEAKTRLANLTKDR